MVVLDFAQDNIGYRKKHFEWQIVISEKAFSNCKRGHQKKVILIYKLGYRKKQF